MSRREKQCSVAARSHFRADYSAGLRAPLRDVTKRKKKKKKLKMATGKYIEENILCLILLHFNQFLHLFRYTGYTFRDGQNFIAVSSLDKNLSNK